ncbi:MAG: amidophosphoribosyltransferase [Candidatus Omnitrophica bacterium]|nr:amidophosphoribosyltransferase [Candidatus Omnitrophota bacterium]MDE2010310.1 amidophosphoribosyltransferase [Candidatus Omnitrophota bacterium]MDE2215277.1 amidophosphoribosyltransferase [Candidatus Omnitrophota bacterium]MDE2232029.1 amidophosphoribosyltransferase [Candidatus Omnitrophota bacterium]
MCGIVGLSHHKEAGKIAFLGLYALQHRGEEAAGIVSYDGRQMHVVKKDGLAVDNFDENSIAQLKGHMAIAHTRYSTTGSSHTKNIQPILVSHRKRPMALAHNGNLINTDELYTKLENEGSIFQTSMDSEIFVHLLAKTPNGAMAPWLTKVFSQVEGAYSVVLLLEGSLIGARDPHGFRPLCLGKLGDGYILASESCAFDLMNAEFVREVAPGEIVIIKGNKLESVFLPGCEKTKKSFCVFENIYFARPDSTIFGDNIYQVRKRLGAQLAIEHPADADFVLGIPDSGNYAALGYAQQLKMPFEEGIIRNHYIGRTFIQPTQFLREFRVRVKLNPIREVIKGKKVVVIEDSIVRGTTSRSRIEGIREAGAKEIHMRISCPPIKSPCFYGIDFPSTGELIAHNKTVAQIADFIKVDSLGFLSLGGMMSVMKNRGDFCCACFTGQYPTALPKNTDKLKLEKSGEE